MSRVLAVDWGERRLGVAISDPSGWLARSLPTLRVQSGQEAVREVVALARREEASEVVVGLPLNMDGSRGPSATSAEGLARKIAAESGLPVHMWDERLTSAQARRMEHTGGEGDKSGDRTEGGRRGGRHKARRAGRRGGSTHPDKGRIDARAAEILLQSFLDARGPRPGQR